MTIDGDGSQGDTGAAGTNGGDNGNGGDGGSQTTFLDTIQNEDLRGNEFLKDFDSPDSLAEDYVKLRTSQPVVPENADGYKADLPEGTILDENDFNEFKTHAHELGLTNDQWEAMIKYDHARNQKWQAEQEQAVKDAEAELTKEWGGKYQENISKATEVLDKAGFKDLGDADFLATNTQFAKFLFHLSTIISEDKLHLGDRKPEGGDTRKLDDAGKPMLNFPDMEK